MLLRLMEKEASALGVQVVSFRLHFNSYRALGRFECQGMDARQRYLLRGAVRLLLAMAAQESDAQERELALIETAGRLVFGFRLDWHDPLTGRRLMNEGARKLREIERWA